MRKVFSLLLSLCLFVALAVGVAADVIWEPYGDSFYDAHREEMQYENRYYKATADLAQYDEPGGRILNESVIFADDLFNVQYVYEDENGKLWGNCYVPGEDSVWALLDGCVRPYDRAAFADDYGDQFVAVETQPDISFYADEVPLYDYPGAEDALYNMIVDADSEYLPEYAHAYTDEVGNVWGELLYFRGMKGWVLLEGDITTVKAPAKERDFPIGTTEPAQTDLTEADATIEQNTLSEENTEAATTDEPADPVAKQNYAVPVLLVVAVVAVTLAVLFVFFRKKKQ